jgi:hypothetical protein
MSIGANGYRTSEEGFLKMVCPSLFSILGCLRLAGTILLVLLAPMQKVQQPLRLVLDLRFALLPIALSAEIAGELTSKTTRVHIFSR